MSHGFTSKIRDNCKYRYKYVLPCCISTDEVLSIEIKQELIGIIDFSFSIANVLVSVFLISLFSSFAVLLFSFMSLLLSLLLLYFCSVLFFFKK